MLQPAKVYPALEKALAVNAVPTSVVIDWLAIVPLVELFPLKVTVLVLAVQPAKRVVLELGVYVALASPTFVPVEELLESYQPAKVYPVLFVEDGSNNLPDVVFLAVTGIDEPLLAS